VTRTNRWTAELIAVSVSLLTAAAVHASPDVWQQKVTAVHRLAEQERQKLGLADDRDALAKSHPAPELTLQTPVKLMPGANAKLSVSGKFATGTRFVLESDDIEVSNEKVSSTKYEANITVRRGALPAEVYLTAYAPVSASSTRVVAVEIIGTYFWNLQLANGDRMKVSVAPRWTGDRNARVEWRRKDELYLKTTAAVTSSEGEIKIDVSPDEQNEEPQRLPPEQMAQHPQRAVTADKRQPKCGVLKLRLAGSELTGTFTPCSGDRRPVPVTGRSLIVGP